MCVCVCVCGTLFADLRSAAGTPIRRRGRPFRKYWRTCATCGPASRSGLQLHRKLRTLECIVTILSLQSLYNSKFDEYSMSHLSYTRLQLQEGGLTEISVALISCEELIKVSSQNRIPLLHFLPRPRGSMLFFHLGVAPYTLREWQR